MANNPSQPEHATAAADDTAKPVRNYPSADLIQHTIRVWEPRLGRPLSEEDARQILENVVGFFRVLHDWNRKERHAASEAEDIDDERE